MLNSTEIRYIFWFAWIDAAQSSMQRCAMNRIAIPKEVPTFGLPGVRIGNLSDCKNGFVLQHAAKCEFELLHGFLFMLSRMLRH
jgi:hypothetical protein